MKCYIKFIGVIDQEKRIHKIELYPGVNIITGKSSTGKSAVLEIFDYCFGSSDNTLPTGIITENAKFFFTILRIKGSYLYLVRNYNGSKSFIFENKLIRDEKGDFLLNEAMLESVTSRSLYDYKKELGRYFNVTMSSIDEDSLYVENNFKKKATPSVRSFMSFMLQHQNLIANKHAIFYRFDEKQKREQAIEHLPIFLGFANENYYQLKQDISDIDSKIKKLSYLIPKRNIEKENLSTELNYLLDVYENLTGSKLIDSNVEKIIKDAPIWLKQLSESRTNINTDHDKAYKEILLAEQKRTEVLALKRNKERERAKINMDTKHIDAFTTNITDISFPESAELHVSKCPFCFTENQESINEANTLTKSINWLNNELKSSPYVKESLIDIDKKLSKEISLLNSELKLYDKKINNFYNEATVLQNKQINYIDLVNQSRYRVIFQLEKIAKNLLGNETDELEKLKKHKDILLQKIKGFNVEHKMLEAENYLSSYMNKFGSKLDFEEGYKPINLKFSFESFDLWNEKSYNKEKKKIFLRSMGSGANWLYCHLSLFVGFLRLFAKLENQCKIPPILFLDQPTQVYFPSLDTSEDSFIPHTLSVSSGDKINHDVEAVSNFFTALIDFCEETLLETNYKPQIIISDHADNITLGNNLEFNKYVRARWRTRGFIDKENPS
ncbi:DUF3732 domain-containing protein [Enterobacter mori]